MWRAAAVLLTLALITFLEFELYPGHTYLVSGTQLYVPELEHLVSPGYLTRDLVATNPNVTYTIYDEVTLFLHNAGHRDLKTALLLQQFALRFAGLLGIYLLARATGLKIMPSLLVAALINAGTFLAGPGTWLIDREPVPRVFSLELVFLALGCFAIRKPFLAGLFGGAALLYDVTMAAPLWLVMLIIYLCDRKMRRQLQPVAPIFLVFVLLLANLAQLQQGTPDSQPTLARVSTRLAAIEQYRSPDLWVSLWPAQFVYLYLALCICAFWAVTRLWSILNRELKWSLALLPLVGILSLPGSALLLDHYRLAAILRIQPLQLLVYTVLVAWFSCALAGIRAWKHSGRVEGSAWSIVCVVLLVSGLVHYSRPQTNSSISQLATWAEDSTWGSSVFLFPDAGRDVYPGVFRALSRRALWVDWESGNQAAYHVALAPEWFDRWQTTMRGPITGDRLQTMLSLPIDYYVLNGGWGITAVLQGERRTVKPIHSEGPFAVYDANTLRSMPGYLTVIPTSR